MDNRLGMEDLIEETVRVGVSDADNGVTLTFKGTVDTKDPSPLLNPFFDQLHARVRETRVPVVYADFSQLTFINSSGIKSLIRWIRKLMFEEARSAYRIVILYDAEMTWQATSLKTLTYLAPEYVSAEARKGGRHA